MPTSDAQLRAIKKYIAKNKEIVYAYRTAYNQKYREENREEYNAKQKICCAKYYAKRRAYEIEAKRLRNIDL